MLIKLKSKFGVKVKPHTQRHTDTGTHTHTHTQFPAFIKGYLMISIG